MHEIAVFFVFFREVHNKYKKNCKKHTQKTQTACFSRVDVPPCKQAPPTRPRAKGSRLYSLLGTLAALLLRDFARHRDFLQHNKPLQKQV